MLKKAVYNREDFLKLNNLPQRLRIWAEDTELEDYIRDEAFYHRALPRKAPMALEPLKVAAFKSLSFNRNDLVTSNGSVCIL